MPATVPTPPEQPRMIPLEPGLTSQLSPRVMFPMAKYSLWAHLLKLAREGRAVESGGRWEPPG